MIKLLDKSIIIRFDVLNNCCGLFYGDFLCKERDKCCSFDCPIAVEADLADIKETDIKIYNEIKKNEKTFPEDWEHVEYTQEGEEYRIPPNNGYDILMRQYKQWLKGYMKENNDN